MIDLKTEHLTGEQLVLHYYQEGQGTLAAELRALHLDDCAACRGELEMLASSLGEVDEMTVPDPGPDYGERVWRALEPSLPRSQTARQIQWWWHHGWRVAAAFAVAVVLVWVGAEFRVSKPDPQVSRRVLAAAVGDYLDRSQAVLLELSNAQSDQPLDISAERERAQDLVTENRLYRQTALDTEQLAMAGALEELERVLLDIAHAPAEISPDQLEELRTRLESAGILFKIRVLGANVRTL